MSAPDEKIQIPIERQNFLIDAIIKIGPRPELLNSDNHDEVKQSVSISVLSGGITNELFRVKNKATSYSVVVRIYGKETDRLISRDAEQFFQSKFLRTFGRHGDVLIYEFLDGLRALEPDEMPKHSDDIATTLADFHVRASNYALQTIPYATQELHSITVTTKWIEVARKAAELNPEKFPGLAKKVEGLQEACDFLRPLLEKAKSVLPVVICHNDLLSGNIMVPRDITSPASSSSSSSTRFIDFEYCRRDFALFDVANHWNEWAGYNNDFSKYPSKSAQETFLRTYFKNIAKMTNASAEETTAQFLSDESIRRACVAANFLSLASNLAWSVWSIVQHVYSVIDFDYMEYYELKFKRFNETKVEFSEAFVKEFKV